MSVQLTSVERKSRKRFTAQQKLQILREWEAAGNGVEVADRHGIHPMTLYRWRKRPETGAAVGTIFPNDSRFLDKSPVSL